MKKILLSVAFAICAAGAIAASPPTVHESPPGFAAARIEAVKQDVNPVSLTVADSGSGAESAYKAWVKKTQSAAAPMERSILSHILFQRLGASPEHGGGGGCLTASGPGDGDGEDDAQDNSIRRPLT